MSDIDRIGEELRKRVLQDGVIFLEQEGKLNGILADMFPELKKERRWIRMAMEKVVFLDNTTQVIDKATAKILGWI